MGMSLLHLVYIKYSLYLIILQGMASLSAVSANHRVTTSEQRATEILENKKHASKKAKGTTPYEITVTFKHQQGKRAPQLIPGFVTKQRGFSGNDPKSKVRIFFILFF